MTVAIAFHGHPIMSALEFTKHSGDVWTVCTRVYKYVCMRGVYSWFKSLQSRFRRPPSLLPFNGGGMHVFGFSSQDFTSSQSWSVESSTSESPTSIAIINEISESLLTAGSCSPERKKEKCLMQLTS